MSIRGEASQVAGFRLSRRRPELLLPAELRTPPEARGEMEGTRWMRLCAYCHDWKSSAQMIHGSHQCYDCRQARGGP